MPRILFVCTGNTCRSPMAEAILKSKNIEGVEVKSAGIYAANGMEASENAKKVLDSHHIPHDHHSTLLTKAAIGWADLILTMTSPHKFAILQQYPESTAKVYTLKEFTGEEFDRDITDPFGGDLETYERTFQELEKFIDKVVEKLKEQTRPS